MHNIFQSLITILWLIFILYWAISAVSAKKNIRGNGYTYRLGLAVIFVVLFNIEPFRHFMQDSDFISSNLFFSSIGFILCGAGIAFAVWARRTMGRNWGMPMSIKQGAELVTTGPYTMVRNPIYTGVLTAMLGSILVIGTGWFVPFIIIGLYFIYSAKVEEGLMLKQFPNTYPDYKKKTRMLIPFIF